MNAISGFLEGVGSSVPATVGAVEHPLQALKDVWEAQKDQFAKARASLHAGKYDEALQHLAGSALPVAGPIASNFLDAASDSSVDDHETARRLGQLVALKALPEATGNAVDLAARAPAVVTAAKGAAKGALEAVGEPVSIGGVEIPAALLGVKAHAVTIARGAASGARAALTARAAALRAAATKGYVATPVWADLPEPVPQGVPELQPIPAPALPSGREPGPVPQSEPPPAPQRLPIWARLPEQQHPAQISRDLPAPEPVQAVPAEAPEIGNTIVSPPPEQLPHGIGEAQRIEDAADQHAARLQAQAEDIIWANRAHRADRFAAYLLREGIEPTPVNLARAAKEMGEKGGPPSDETVPMIHDRMNYQPQAAEEATRSRLVETLAPPEPAAAPAAEPPSEMELQLQTSIDAAKAAKVKAATPPGKAPAKALKRIRSVGDLAKINEAR